MLTPAQVPDWFTPDDERIARAAWSRIVEPGDRRATRLIERCGPALALLALYQRPNDVAATLASGDTDAAAGVAGWQARLEHLDPTRDLRTVQRFGGRLVIPSDPDWPEQLQVLGDRAPIALWVRGRLELAATCRRAVALVGCRACSSYGEWVAAELAAGCADRHICVVSGAAYGIDACAHRAALATGGLTVAVLACGVERPYPRGNEQLIERIAAEGLVVSEIPPGSAPTRWRFVTRNRLIAALSQATVVVEAGWRSGASITAREAVDQGRALGAVPGPVSSVSSAGCHRLLREGAVCVTDAGEIAELIAPIGSSPAVVPAVPAAVHDDLQPVDLRVFDALPVRTGVGLDRLVRTCGLDAGTVGAALGRLELRGLAVGEVGVWRRAPVRVEPALLGGRRPGSPRSIR